MLKKIFFLSRILMVGMSKKHRIMFVLFNFIHLYFATTKLYLYLVFSSLLKNFPVSHLYCVSLETRYSLLNVITASLINLHFRFFWDWQIFKKELKKTKWLEKTQKRWKKKKKRGKRCPMRIWNSLLMLLKWLYVTSGRSPWRRL